MLTPTQKADVLIEALGWIRQFRDKITVIKLGGSVMEDRDATRSTIITSQLPSDRWHEHLADPILADAILDRVVHRAHRLTLGGPSRRKPTGNGSSPKGDT